MNTTSDTNHCDIAPPSRREKGSALLVSLMVMVGLSLLGLGFVAITETESVIAVNERNTAQALAAAEAGARVVVEWFQDPEWCSTLGPTTAYAQGLLPKNLNAFKTERSFPGDPDKNGYYKPNAGDLLFDKPFRGSPGNRLFGDGDRNPVTADVWIQRGRNDSSTIFLDGLSSRLFLPDPTHNESVRISDIRVYAPPIPGAQQNANGFWEDGDVSRYGLATVRVTAQKLAGDRVVAERYVKFVMAETPFPTVDGAIETSGTLVGQGSFEVYWGKVLSERGVQLARPAVGMPWFDAKNSMWYEYGYDTIWPRADNTNYLPNAVVSAPLSAQNTRPDVLKFSYRATTVTGTGLSAATAPADADWPTAEGDTLVDNEVTWTAEAARSNFPIVSHPLNYASREWLYQILDADIGDPWLHARARQEVRYHNNATVPCGQATFPHPCKYDDPVLDNLEQLYSNFFQYQYTTEAPNREEVVFPTMDYEFWKNIAMSSNNENGVYYLKYADGPTGTSNDFIGPGGRRESIYYWLNSITNPATGKPHNGLGPGFYFFDTKNSRNPQFEKGGILTPDVMIAANVAPAYGFQMQGYIYLNARFYGSTGQGNIIHDDVYQMPGEPFRDVGYREVDLSTDPDWKFRLEDATTLPAGNFVWRGRSNGFWDFQDVNENASFDLYLAERTATKPDGGTVTAWLPVPFFPGCTITDNTLDGAVTANGCSEPHEPYLNFTYPAVTDRKGGVRVEWFDPRPAAVGNIPNVRRPKLRTGINTTVTCGHGSSLAECTSNKYDIDGSLVSIDPLLWGALYNEGGYDGSGNARYYGALLMRASFRSTGTPEVYFNECLARGCLEDQLKLQRVTVTSWQTEQ